MTDATCSVQGCTRPIQSRGWCDPHYGRWRKTGDVQAGIPLPPAKIRICSIPECGVRVRARGWCVTHYNRWFEHGDPLFLTEMPVASAEPCSVAGCAEGGRRRQGVCDKHYARLRRHGDVTHLERVRNSGTLEERWWARVRKDGPVPKDRPELGPCWLWNGNHDQNGYGKFSIEDSRATPAHRWGYDRFVEPVPEYLDVDHLCRNRGCVRFTGHLEPVTPQVNNQRGSGWSGRNARKTHCPQGHPYSPENTYITNGARRCRQCRRDHYRARRDQGWRPAPRRPQGLVPPSPGSTSF